MGKKRSTRPTTESDPVDDCHEKPCNCKWSDRPSDKWLKTVDGWPWDEESKGSEPHRKSVPCVRCGHRIWVETYSGPLLLERELLGHADPKSTMIYVNLANAPDQPLPLALRRAA